ncbi:MAG TPA: NAD(P)H-binding protein [Mycobacteriales bacterium]|jgi:NADH dehydrogenase|nr:NAD(P)H-binding protein [Mycobacteriales bacterium]
MRIAVTGGTGFVGGHLAQRLAAEGHEVVVLSRGVDQRERAAATAGTPGIRVARGTVLDEAALRAAFEGCDAVAHCAGVNREVGEQTFAAVHVDGTRNVVAAAEAAGVRRLVLLSFLRARPACGSPYHETKWAAEELVRASSLDWTVLKPGMVYGRGDHFTDHLSHALFTFPVYVGIGAQPVAPLWVGDLVDVLVAALVEGRLARRTVPVLGPERLGFDDAVRRIAGVLGRRVRVVRLPMAFHEVLGWVTERVMTVPLVARAQVRMLREGIVDPVLAPDALPDDLLPRTAFAEPAIRAALPPRGGFTRRDLRCVNDPLVRVG